MLGKTLAHYQIIAPLGQGGMGEVYLAKDGKLGRKVAIKVLPPNIGEDQALLERFRREAKALAALNHPHIATIHVFDIDQEVPFIVLEFVAGQTLNERLASGPFSLEEAIRIAQQIARAVNTAHENGIIHRDLKPSNIKFTTDGNVKVLDFGLARFTQSDVSEESAPDASTLHDQATEPGIILGTPAYMSPEQARGQSADQRADIWAFGCCLYEMLSGQKPFTGQTASDLMAEILKSEPDWNLIPSTTPPGVTSLLRRCLEKSPKNRLSHLGDIAITLEENLNSDVLAAKSPRNVTRLKRDQDSTSQALGRWMPALVTFLLGIGVAALFLPVFLSPQSLEKSVAIIPFETLGNREETSPLSDGLVFDLITTLQTIDGLKVQGPISSLRFKDHQALPKEIGQTLQVNHLLTGSISQDDHQLRINANLIETATGFSLWSASYDRTLTDIFDIRTDVAQQVAKALQIELGFTEQQRLSQSPTTSPTAYAQYLKGRAHWNRRTPADFKQAIDYFESALAIDPNYARAYAGIADLHSLWSIYSVEDLKDRPERAVTLANKAISIDPTLAEPHATLGFSKFLFDRDWVGAEKEFQAAIKLNRNYAAAYSWYAVMLLCQGRAKEALQVAQRGQALDPAPNNRVIYVMALLHLGRIKEGLTFLQEQMTLDPHFGNYHLFHVQAHVLNNDLENAYRAVETMQSAQIAPERILENEAWVLALQGRKTEARERLTELKRLDQADNDHGAFTAQILLALDDKEGAFQQLNEVIDRESNLFPFLYRQIDWNTVQHDPTFQKIRSRLNLP